MSRPSKSVAQAKKVAPPAVPNDFRHSGSSFGSAGYASSEDGCYVTGVGVLQSSSIVGVAPIQPSSITSNIVGSSVVDDPTYGMPAGKSPGAMFNHQGFTFPSVGLANKYAHAEDQGEFSLSRCEF